MLSRLIKFKVNHLEGEFAYEEWNEYVDQNNQKSIIVKTFDALSPTKQWRDKW